MTPTKPKLSKTFKVLTGLTSYPVLWQSLQWATLRQSAPELSKSLLTYWMMENQVVTPYFAHINRAHVRPRDLKYLKWPSIWHIWQHLSTPISFSLPNRWCHRWSADFRPMFSIFCCIWVSKCRSARYKVLQEQSDSPKCLKDIQFQYLLISVNIFNVQKC